MVLLRSFVLCVSAHTAGFRIFNKQKWDVELYESNLAVSPPDEWSYVLYVVIALEPFLSSGRRFHHRHTGYGTLYVRNPTRTRSVFAPSYMAPRATAPLALPLADAKVTDRNCPLHTTFTNNSLSPKGVVFFGKRKGRFHRRKPSAKERAARERRQPAQSRGRHPNPPNSILNAPFARRAYGNARTRRRSRSH
ncbi:hypothetical protein EVAR_11990_1 [Eumeta japonica]|uniref:Secreted protein n=1 Tax=Eumeta variegata TaxID=151549 RepID=A0A4C1U512_EUMVA|nr:hypothetical protein EVAR_11990_1 [Eumeta japonica]